MTKLSWNDNGERFFETGVDRGVFYPENGDGVPWNGITKVNEQPVGGEAQPIYVDGQKVINAHTQKEYSANIEAYDAPKEFAESEGFVEIYPGLSIDEQPGAAFGLSYRTKIGNDIEGSDKGYKIHCIYNASVDPSDRAYTTLNASPDPLLFSWTLTTIPSYILNHKPTSHVIIDSMRTDPEALEGLEERLYGTETTEPYLPTLEALIYYLQGAHYSWLGSEDNSISQMEIYNNIYENLYTDPRFVTSGVEVDAYENLYTNPRFNTIDQEVEVFRNLYTNPRFRNNQEIVKAKNEVLSPISSLNPILNNDIIVDNVDVEFIPDIGIRFKSSPSIIEPFEVDFLTKAGVTTYNQLHKQLVEIENLSDEPLHIKTTLRTYTNPDYTGPESIVTGCSYTLDPFETKICSCITMVNSINAESISVGIQCYSTDQTQSDPNIDFIVKDGFTRILDDQTSEKFLICEGKIDPDYTFNFLGSFNDSPSVLKYKKPEYTMEAIVANTRIDSIRTSANGSSHTFTILLIEDLPQPFGFEPGKTYTILATFYQEEPQIPFETDPDLSRLIELWGVGGEGFSDDRYTYRSEQAPNESGEYDLRLTVTIPEDSLSSRIQLINGSKNVDSYWSNIAVIEGNYSGPYFNGSASLDSDLIPSWFGVEDDSVSILSGIQPANITPVNCIAIQSDEFAPNDGKSIRIIPNAESNDSYVSLDLDSPIFGTQTIAAEVHQLELQSGSLIEDRARGIYTSQPEDSSTSSDNKVGSEVITHYQSDSAVDPQEIRLYNGASEGNGDVYWTLPTIVNGSYSRSPFSGDTESSDDRFGYKWSDVEDESTSIMYGVQPSSITTYNCIAILSDEFAPVDGNSLQIIPTSETEPASIEIEGVPDLLTGGGQFVIFVSLNSELDESSDPNARTIEHDPGGERSSPFPNIEGTHEVRLAFDTVVESSHKFIINHGGLKDSGDIFISIPTQVADQEYYRGPFHGSM